MTEATLIHSLTIILTLVVLEGLLSADNALVMAILVRPLPKHQQKRALMYGIVGAFVFRFLMLIFAIWIIKLWYLRAAGGLYLAYLTGRHFKQRTASSAKVLATQTTGFWKTVALVEFTDIAFALDSVLVAVGLSDDLWIVFAGVALGIVAVRVAAGGFLKVLERWPGLEDVAYLLVGWISAKLLIESYGMFEGDHGIEMPAVLFWIGMGGIVLGGTFDAVRRERRARSKKGPSENSAKEIV